MKEFELYSRILSPDFKCPNKTELHEQKSGQKAIIKNRGVKEYELYRFDVEEGRDFLPFFNNRHDNAPNRALEGLRAFCDYIILVCLNDKAFVILVEMKVGKKNAQQQLEASSLFMDYVKNSALRIKEQNGFDEFKPDNVKVRKLLLKPCPKVKNRPTTQPAKNSAIDWGADIIVLRDDMLPLRKICSGQ